MQDIKGSCALVKLEVGSSPKTQVVLTTKSHQRVRKKRENEGEE
jgi:hypothetical protein